MDTLQGMRYALILVIWLMFFEELGNCSSTVAHVQHLTVCQ